MNVMQWFKVVLLSFTVLVFTACSTTSDKTDGAGAAVSDATGGAGDKGVVTGGVGQDADFDSQPDAKKMEVGNQTYYFDFDKSEVYATDKPSIEVQARYLASHPKAKVLLEGHTDPRGSREYNIALGERRANSVADLLKLQGVAQEQIRVVSYGAEKLAAPGHSEEDYKRDRRVRLVYEAK